MRTFKVLCANCDRRLGLGEDWIPAQHPGCFECTRCAAERSDAALRRTASALVPPWHVLASLRAPSR